MKARRVVVVAEAGKRPSRGLVARFAPARGGWVTGCANQATCEEVYGLVARDYGGKLWTGERCVGCRQRRNAAG